MLRRSVDRSDNHEEEIMTLFIVLLILALIVFGVGFAVHLLWWLLIILPAVPVLTRLFGRPPPAGGACPRPAARRPPGVGRTPPAIGSCAAATSWLRKRRPSRRPAS